MYLERITREEILQKTTEYDIFRYYTGYQFQVGEIFSSPFRKDRNPSFGVYRGRKGSLMFKDLSTGESGDCFKLAGMILNLRGFELNKQVYIDLNKGRLRTTDYGLKTLEMGEKEYTVISVKRRNFTTNDDAYWGSFKVIDRDRLKKFNASPIEQYWINGELRPRHYTNDDPIYAYKIYNNFQIYSPLAERKYKFRTNCKEHDLIGYEQLPKNGELLIITKSGKDVFVLDGLGYNAIAPIGEHKPIPQIIIDDIKSRFKRVVILYDNDEAGINGANKIAEATGFDTIFIPDHLRYKDISDYIKDNTVEDSKILLKQLINE